MEGFARFSHDQSALSGAEHIALFRSLVDGENGSRGKSGDGV